MWSQYLSSGVLWPLCRVLKQVCLCFGMQSHSRTHRQLPAHTHTHTHTLAVHPHTQTTEHSVLVIYIYIYMYIYLTNWKQSRIVLYSLIPSRCPPTWIQCPPSCNNINCDVYINQYASIHCTQRDGVVRIHWDKFWNILRIQNVSGGDVMIRHRSYNEDEYKR